MTSRRQDRSGVRVWQHEVDWDNPAWSVLLRLGDVSNCPPGTDEEMALCFRAVMRQAHELGTRYVNPQFTVTAPWPSEDFIRKARQAQRACLKTLKSVLVTSGNLKRELKKRSAIIRQLEITGVMVIDGKHIHPQQWPSGAVASGAIDLAGKQFGRLTAVRPVPNSRWLCKCQCGAEHTVRTKHLLRGKIRSCGCFKAETEARQQERKANRAW
jgi:hypothetical protein